LLAAAEFYLQHHTDGRVECRFDVISIYKPAVGNPLIHHFENAIGYN
jgi:Holliday junction resolvase-like predicted endonuclease